MVCIKCKSSIQDGSNYCSVCGARQDIVRKPKSRGNGQGTVFRRPNGSWTALVTLGYTVDDDGRKHRQTRSKGGFKTKRDAAAYVQRLFQAPEPTAEQKKAIPLRELYEKWEPTHRAGKDTMNCYRAAWKYFSPIWEDSVSDIDIDDLQECVDSCPRGKRTRQNMKALCGLLYKFAIPRHIASMNMGEYLVVGAGEDPDKAGLPIEYVDKLRDSVGKIKCADYIVVQCYTGFRPSEMLALNVEDYDKEHRAFVGGAKTDAGRDRTVTISPKIRPIIDRLIDDRESGPIFLQDNGTRMSLAVYRKLFYEALDAAGLENPEIKKDGVMRKTYTPHSCRHTFATLMKKVNAPDKDKLSLIGHTSTEMLRHYQDVDFAALQNITDQI